MLSSATERAVRRHRDKVGRIPRRSGLAPHRRTKATLWTVGRLLETWTDPREVLLSIASMSVEELCKLTGCSPLEALAEKRLCAVAVLPYLCQRLPTQVSMQHNRAIHLNLCDEQEYQRLVEAAAADDEQPADSFSMTLIGGAPAVEQSVGARYRNTCYSPGGSRSRQGRGSRERSVAESRRWRNLRAVAVRGRLVEPAMTIHAAGSPNVLPIQRHNADFIGVLTSCLGMSCTDAVLRWAGDRGVTAAWLRPA